MVPLILIEQLCTLKNTSIIFEPSINLINAITLHSEISSFQWKPPDLFYSERSTDVLQPILEVLSPSASSAQRRTTETPASGVWFSGTWSSATCRRVEILSVDQETIRNHQCEEHHQVTGQMASLSEITLGILIYLLQLW